MANVNLILDMSNLLYRTFFANMQEPEDIAISSCHHSALMTVNKYYRKYKANRTLMVFDDYSWRKAYTDNLDECVTYKKYKGQRRDKMKLTESQVKRLAKFDEHIEAFYNIMNEKTSVVTMRKRYLEADDLIAGIVQEFPNDTHIIISADKDFIQLLDNPNVSLIDPLSEKKRDLSEWDNDSEYFMFEKCLRGDSGDNVISSYPRIRKTKIKEAYTDEFVKANCMNNVFKVLITDDDGAIRERQFVTGEVFAENKLLMDLREQPEEIRKLMTDCIHSSINNPGKFNYVSFLKFCGKYELARVVDEIDFFTPLLSGQPTRS